MYSSFNIALRLALASSLQYILLYLALALFCDEVNHQQRFEYISMISGEVPPLLLKNNLRTALGSKAEDSMIKFND